MIARAEAVEANSCSACSSCNTSQLTRLGIKAGGWDHVVALMGNPNTGKSTIFNSLTGLRQHVGNWPGKTVARAEGAFNYNDKKYKVVDLPGTYSLLSTSVDEEIARDFVLFGRPDVTVVVADAARLERNLGLAMQVLEITGRVVVALNLMDEARGNGVTVDERALTRDLGVPVVPMAARRGEGLAELLSAVDNVARGEYPTRPRRIKYRDAQLEAAVAKLAAQLESAFDELPNARWVALRLLEGDESIVRAIGEGTLGEIRQPNTFVNLAKLEAR
jgi:ferrous iron transport protein B